ncbi:MAG: hypothetical protein PHN75_02680 [Syntrophales bacterium]|nr:hypothetical protein [Syntrophales bacterium]
MAISAIATQFPAGKGDTGSDSTGYVFYPLAPAENDQYPHIPSPLRGEGQSEGDSTPQSTETLM